MLRPQHYWFISFYLILRERHSSPYCCWSLWWISADGTFSTTRNLITMRCSKLRGTFCSLITLTSPRQDWTGSNPSRREGGGCGFTLSRSHSCCAVRPVYIQISPGHIWTTLYNSYWTMPLLAFFFIVCFLLLYFSYSIHWWAHSSGDAFLPLIALSVSHWNSIFLKSGIITDGEIKIFSYGI